MGQINEKPPVNQSPSGKIMQIHAKFTKQVGEIQILFNRYQTLVYKCLGQVVIKKISIKQRALEVKVYPDCVFQSQVSR